MTTATGDRLWSHTAVSAVTDALWPEEAALQQRSLAEIPLLDLFVDAVYAPRRRTGSTREAVLAAWGGRRMGARCGEASVSAKPRVMRPGEIFSGISCGAGYPVP